MNKIKITLNETGIYIGESDLMRGTYEFDEIEGYQLISLDNNLSIEEDSSIINEIEEVNQFRKENKMNINTLWILSQICTRDESGRHFTQIYSREEISSLESQGLIEIHRPRHESGIEYEPSYWSVNLTLEGHDYVNMY